MAHRQRKSPGEFLASEIKRILAGIVVALLAFFFVTHAIGPMLRAVLTHR